MGRKRVNQTHLPQHLMVRSDCYYYVIRVEGKQKWLPLGKDEADASRHAIEFNEMSNAARKEAFGALRIAGEQLKAHVLARDDNRCVYCGATSDLEIDHVIPYTAGGATTAKNLVVACTRCNLRKGDGDVRELLFQLNGLTEMVLRKYVTSWQ